MFRDWVVLGSVGGGWLYGQTVVVGVGGDLLASSGGGLLVILVWLG